MKPNFIIFLLIACLTHSYCQDIATAQSSGDPVGDSVNTHNAARSEYSLPGLTWNDTLAASALAYAQTIAAAGTFQHSGTEGIGENLWMGTAGAYKIVDMVQAWVDEKQYYVDGIFPDVSSTGNWEDVGHYTQIIWVDTTQVGCGLANGPTGDYYVCQYYPPGNYEGQNALLGSQTQGQADQSPEEPADGSQGQDIATAQSSGDPVGDSVNTHNAARSEYSLPGLTWNDTLAASALAYAQTIAAAGTFQHSGTEGIGENLWMGTAGAYKIVDMVQAWVDEKQYYVDGIFPDVSSTGNWEDVGHYTQIIWVDTTQVGCGLANGPTGDYYVCQYYPPGNYEGQNALLGNATPQTGKAVTTTKSKRCLKRRR